MRISHQGKKPDVRCPLFMSAVFSILSPLKANCTDINIHSSVYLQNKFSAHQWIERKIC